MPPEPTQYRRVPAARGIRSFFLRRGNSVWIADDHLLSVEFRWFLESYHRFAYRDIQALLLRKTVTGAIVNVLCGFVVTIWFLASLGSAEGFAAGLVPGGLCVFVLVANVLRGPTCDLRIVTAVQSRRLHGLRRLNEARRAIAEIEPFILAAQAELAPAETLVTEQPAPEPQPAAEPQPGAPAP